MTSRRKIKLSGTAGQLAPPVSVFSCIVGPVFRVLLELQGGGRVNLNLTHGVVLLLFFIQTMPLSPFLLCFAWGNDEQKL